MENLNYMSDNPRMLITKAEEARIDRYPEDWLNRELNVFTSPLESIYIGHTRLKRLTRKPTSKIANALSDRG